MISESIAHILHFMPNFRNCEIFIKTSTFFNIVRILLMIFQHSSCHFSAFGLIEPFYKQAADFLVFDSLFVAFCLSVFCILRGRQQQIPVCFKLYFRFIIYNPLLKTLNITNGSTSTFPCNNVPYLSKRDTEFLPYVLEAPFPPSVFCEHLPAGKYGYKLMRQSVCAHFIPLTIIK